MISKKSIKLLKVVMLSCLMMCLMGCQLTEKKDQKLNVKWELFEYPPGRKLACLEEHDVMELREKLIRCGELSSD